MTNYPALWKKTDSLINQKGLPQSALTEVENIYALAKKEKQDAQIIKALIYKSSLQAMKDENGSENGIAAMEQELQNSTGAVAAILNSLIADKYLSYFQQHRWQFYNRSTTVNFNKADIATWSADDFHSRISTLYLASLKDEKTLQQTKLEPFDPIITKGNLRFLRPTLYDLLINRALDYFKNDERTITKPAYAFEIKDASYFSNASNFAALQLSTQDTASLFFKALKLYQQLLAFHLHDEKPDALIDADISRLEFVNAHGVMPDKESLYEKALTVIADKYKNNTEAAQASYLLATIHSNRAASYDPLKSDDKNAKGEYIVAANICRQVLQQKDGSEGSANCFNLLQSIEKKELNLTTEKVNIPGQPFRTLVNYRNFDKLYLRVAPLTDDQMQKLANRYDEAYWKNLVSITSLRNWEQALPATNDYHKHNAEIKIESLPVGRYMLLASNGADFSLDKNAIAVQFFYVSAISYVNNQLEYFILNRESGQPLAGATLQTWWSQYDYNSRTYKKTKGEKQIADKNGYLSLTKKSANSNRNGNLQLEITTSGDKLFMDDNEYVYYREANYSSSAINAATYESDKAKVFFFTDRSLYRPGQTVYFKGIAITKDFNNGKNKVYSKISSRVFLRNANGEDIDSLQLTTNEYGSYSGKFILPQGLLNGQFTLIDEDIDGNTSFSVEEYKRPKFYVEYEPVKGSYKVNDSITVTGVAKAYAGNNVDGAQVKYRVQRVARFIYPWLYWRWGYPQASNMEIANGTVTTDADGKFKIDFKAIPDLSVNKDLEPIFDYSISADVTDINGETRSGHTSVPVAYKALQINIGVSNGASILADSLKNIGVYTTNVSGTPEQAQVSISISKLQSPDRLIRKRYWQQPDQFVMSREEYIQNFPNDEYENESNYQGWKKDKPIYSKTDSSNGRNFSPANIKFTEGWYAIEATAKDKYGEPIKDIKYIQVYNEKSNALPAASYTWSSQNKSSIEPGEESTIYIGSSAKDIYLIQQVDKQKDQDVPALRNAKDSLTKGDYHFITLNGKQSFSFPATEDDRGGFGVYHFFIKNNRFYSFSNQVMVPWSNKELKISYETFRDKTLPGSDEKWKLKISGYKNEKVAAEMLASMYDASLDQFKPHGWYQPNIWPYYYNYYNWSANNCFSQVNSQTKYISEAYRSVIRNYDALLRLDYGYPGGRGGMKMARAEAAVAAPMMSRSLRNDDAISQNLDKEKKANFSHDMNSELNEVVVTDPKHMKMPKAENDNDSNSNTSQVQIRKNFNETAFFFPDLKTDAAGNIEFGFTIPEALTQWKFQALAHTKDLAMAVSTNSVVTQKQLMVQPNTPRFLREGDKLEMSTKVVNLTDKEVTGTVQLELINTATNQSVSGWFHNITPTQYFTAAAGQSTVVKFSIDVPYQYNSAVSYRFVAVAGENSDGEEAAIPILTNSMLVTESMPLPMRGTADKNFRFEKLLQSGNSETLQQHALTVEFTTNPAWYAVQALPYLMDYPYECAEQTFNRYYANALATKIANSTPRLKEIFEKWKNTDSGALLSNLQKNQELKAVLLEETPWVMDAKNEAQQKKNIALLFDMLKMNAALASSFEKLKQLQSENGGFVWFKGGRDDRYMTQYIVTGFGHLTKMDALSVVQQKEWLPIVTKAVKYLDERIKEDYDYLVKHKIDLNKNNLGYVQVQYLYMRSFFAYIIPGASSFNAINYYRKQSQQFWLQQSKYMQGMIALSLYRSADVKTADDILKSLKQNAIVNEEMGMYWKENAAGYYWYQAPIETHSLLIEAFSEISKDNKIVNDLKTWLLKQKQTQNWQTTKATAEACYALLLQGNDWLSNTPTVEIKLGDKIVSSANQPTEAGTGYFKQTIDGPFVKPEMGDISVKITSNNNKNGNPPAWGAVYWQYFEHLDKITPAATPLQLKKQLFVEKNTDKGPVLEPVLENAYLKVGDKIKVRIELRVDRDMEYVHMKDMRASCMEPVNVLSGYKWQDALGYYESTKDASTNFFFGWLPKGTYVFEYPLFVTHTGNFSNGVTSIQCMYAPEFASHSEGVRVNVE
ncbi:MAG: alpha-2-macroglobulin family protein [Chitinophagaceae bacterium]